MLLTDPKVLLLDEPTRGIDVGAKGEIFALLFREAKKGLAVLYVTSEVGEALTASHRIVVMSKGRDRRASSTRAPPPAMRSWPPPASTSPTTPRREEPTSEPTTTTPAPPAPARTPEATSPGRSINLNACWSRAAR